MNAIQSRNVTGWATYAARRLLAFALVGIVVAGAVGALVAGGLWLAGAGPWATTAQNGLEATPAQFVAPTYQIGAFDAPGPEIPSQAVTRRADDQGIGYSSADEAGANCGPGETVLANWRGGFSCNIER